MLRVLALGSARAGCSPSRSADPCRRLLSLNDWRHLACGYGDRSGLGLALSALVTTVGLAACRPDAPRSKEQPGAAPPRLETPSGSLPPAPPDAAAPPRANDAPTVAEPQEPASAAIALSVELERIKSSIAVIEADTEVLRFDEESFNALIDAFATASRSDPSGAMRVMEGEPAELRSAVMSSHLERLWSSYASAPTDYINSISEDDDRKGAAWSFARTLLESGLVSETEVTRRLALVEGINSRTAARMTVSTANQIARERASQGQEPSAAFP